MLSSYISVSFSIKVLVKVSVLFKFLFLVVFASLFLGIMDSRAVFNLESLRVALGSDTNPGTECIKTLHSKCYECGGKLTTRKQDKGLLTIFGKDGVRHAIQEENRCLEVSCRTSHFYSHRVVKGGIKKYETFCLHPDRKFLVVSRKTAFDIDLLYEMSLSIFHHNATFLALAEEYNDAHYTGNTIIFIEYFHIFKN